MRLLIVILASLVMAACSSSHVMNQSVNVMVMVEDSAEDAIPADSRAIKRLVANVSGGLSDQGINVYDETALTLDDFSFRHASRTKAALIDVARSVKGVHLDYLVILSADAYMQSKSYTNAMSTKAFASIINLGSGRVIGNVSSRGSNVNAKQPCDTYCVNEHLSDSLSSVGGELADSIAARLPAAKTMKQPKPKRVSGMSQDWVLTFDGFTQQDMSSIEEYLTIFSGYQDLRYVESSHRYAEIWYTSTISSAKLNRNLKRMLKEIDERAVINFEGNHFTVKKITLRGKENKQKFDTDGW